ncbi:MAG: protein translocase subunit SecF [Chitinispirillia bacterium]|jgi:preprotein translocase subunit SecF
MQLFKSPNINFIGNRDKAFIFSGILITITLIFFIINKGLNLSIDFVGGTVIQLKFEKSITNDLGKIRSAVTGLNFGQPEVKTIGSYSDNEIQIIVQKQEEGTRIGDEIKAALSKELPDNPFDLRKEEKVGAKIGKEFQRNGIIATMLSLIIILVYIGIRFHLPFGIAAIIALFHDVIITVGVFAVFDAEFSLPIIASILTIIGYSLNDTIVVFDRIRENLGGLNVKKSFEDRINTSINQCMSRTVITSVTTLLVVISLFSFFYTTGDVIKFFSGALLTGVLIGTYSSMFIASPVLILWNKKWPIKK